MGCAATPTARSGSGELLELIDLPDAGDRMPHQLSGGMQQRVAVARALAPRPDVILLDEPFSSLDAALRTQLRGDVREILRTAGTAAVFVTHDQDEALTLGDRMAVMVRGRIEQVAPPEVVYGEPATPFVATFVGTANLVHGDSGRAGRDPLRCRPAGAAGDRRDDGVGASWSCGRSTSTCSRRPTARPMPGPGACCVGGSPAPRSCTRSPPRTGSGYGSRPDTRSGGCGSATPSTCGCARSRPSSSPRHTWAPRRRRPSPPSPTFPVAYLPSQTVPSEPAG